MGTVMYPCGIPVLHELVLTDADAHAGLPQDVAKSGSKSGSSAANRWHRLVTLVVYISSVESNSCLEGFGRQWMETLCVSLIGEDRCIIVEKLFYDIEFLSVWSITSGFARAREVVIWKNGCEKQISRIHWTNFPGTTVSSSSHSLYRYYRRESVHMAVRSLSLWGLLENITVRRGVCARGVYGSIDVNNIEISMREGCVYNA
ncbi:hypothetical protein Tco_1376529 [Tanacetum coccineum]